VRASQRHVRSIRDRLPQRRDRGAMIASPIGDDAAQVQCVCVGRCARQHRIHHGVSFLYGA
jgi:hypothetical protein